MDENFYDNLESMVKKNSSSQDIHKIVFTTFDGKDIEYEIVATFKSKKNKKIYYVMTDSRKNPNNQLIVSAFYINYDESSTELNEENEKFYPVIDNDELTMVYDVFDKIVKNNKEELV